MDGTVGANRDSPVRLSIWRRGIAGGNLIENKPGTDTMKTAGSLAGECDSPLRASTRFGGQSMLTQKA